MHREILTKEQISLLSLIKSFSCDFGLVGRTAIALLIGHRRSIDFDLFSNKKFDNFKIRKKIISFSKIDNVIKDGEGEYTLVFRGVKITFFHYPYAIRYSRNFGNIIKLPNLLTLAAMKAFALGRRAKWKDYVDLFFIMKSHHSIDEIITKSKKLYGKEFNEKLFRSQLAYFIDIDCSEELIYMTGSQTDDELIKKEIINFSLS